MTRASVAVWWIPLGAGGRFVAFNGRAYERWRARREHREPRPLYHTALEVHAPEGRYVIENAWPIPDERGDARGVVVTGPVFSRRLGRFRALRYEVRCWKDGTTDDAAYVVAKPVVSEDPDLARRVLRLVAQVPPKVWGRDEDRLGEMWNSNSVVAWILARAGVDPHGVLPPRNGRAPGWDAGATLAAQAGRTDAVAARA